MCHGGTDNGDRYTSDNLARLAGTNEVDARGLEPPNLGGSLDPVRDAVWLATEDAAAQGDSFTYRRAARAIDS